MGEKRYTAAEVAAVAMQGKSMVLGLILAFFFGSIGLLYASILLGLVGLVIEGIVWLLAVATFGLGAVLIIPWHIFSMILVAVLIHSHNKRLLAKLG
ncbi:MAG: hypothetical protein LBV79_05485 [Candidatus Adiutrix sp.]|jgi:hypothetical protein|nr:hypothetical protein [Candidatus Adiutrix sp.]